jgi:hypothetical protein
MTLLGTWRASRCSALGWALQPFRTSHVVADCSSRSLQERQTYSQVEAPFSDLASSTRFLRIFPRKTCTACVNSQAPYQRVDVCDHATIARLGRPRSLNQLPDFSLEKQPFRTGISTATTAESAKLRITPSPRATVPFKLISATSSPFARINCIALLEKDIPIECRLRCYGTGTRLSLPSTIPLRSCLSYSIQTIPVSNPYTTARISRSTSSRISPTKALD